MLHKQAEQVPHPSCSETPSNHRFGFLVFSPAASADDPCGANTDSPPNSPLPVSLLVLPSDKCIVASAPPLKRPIRETHGEFPPRSRTRTPSERRGVPEIIVREELHDDLELRFDSSVHDTPGRTRDAASRYDCAKIQMHRTVRTHLDLREYILRYIRCAELLGGTYSRLRFRRFLASAGFWRECDILQRRVLLTVS